MTLLFVRSKGFAITATAFSIALIIISSLVVIVNQQIAQTSAQDDLSDNIIDNVNSLNYFYTQYLLYQGLNTDSNLPVQLNPNPIFDNILGNLTSFSGLNEPETLGVQASQRFLNDTKYLFNIMLYNASYERLSIGFYNLVTEQLGKLESHVNDLSIIVNDQANELMLYNVYLLITLIGLISTFIVFIYFQIFRRTLKSVKKLQNEEKRLTACNEELRTEISERTRQLRESERLATIGQVAGMVGHDIRNPLQAIVSELYLAKQSIDEGQKVKKHPKFSKALV